MLMHLDSNRYNILSALIMHEIDFTYISIPHIYKCFASYVFFLIIIVIFCHPANCGIWNTNRAYLRKVTGKKTGISKPVTLLVSVDQLIDLQLTSNSIWFHEILYENVDAYWSSSQDPIDELLWMVLVYYTQLYIEFSWKIN